MDPNSSPFRRPPPRPTFRPPRSGFGPVRAASSTAGSRTAPAARGRSRGVAHDARARALRLGAGAFYVVAALTLLDAAIAFVARDPGAIIGLGLTRRVAGATPVAWMALPFVVGYLLLGVLAQRGRLWAFAIGAAVYALDGLIVVAAHDWVAVAIHIVVLVMMVRGLDAGRRGF
jgi:hypothetical protein